MSNPLLAIRLDELVHELDMIVFRLERAPAEQIEALLRERKELRRELERARDEIRELARQL